MTVWAEVPGGGSRAEWLSRWRRGHTILASALSLAAAAWLFASEPIPLGAQAVIMAVLVAVVGLPHGAYDLESGRRLLSGRFGALWSPVFVTAYLIFAGLAGALWALAPLVGLWLLLVIGAVHWGDEDVTPAKGRRSVHLWLAISRGAIPVAVPCLAHPAQVAEIFTWLGAPSGADTVLRLSLWASALAAPGVVAELALAPSARRGLILLEITSITLMLVAAPPLLGFTIYFCGWHSVRHSMRSASRIDAFSSGRAITAYARAVAAPTAVTIAGAMIIFAVLQAAGQELAERSIAQIVFIGLFALTVPHVLLGLMTHTHRSEPLGVDAAAG